MKKIEIFAKYVGTNTRVLISDKKLIINAILTGVTIFTEQITVLRGKTLSVFDINDKTKTIKLLLVNFSKTALMPKQRNK